MATPLRTVQEVFDLARPLLNDSQGALWTDDKLLPFVKSASRWLWNQIARHVPTVFDRVQGQPYTADIPYTAGVVDITSTLPADLYLPEKLEYRINATDDWIPLNRLIDLPTQLNAPPASPTNWCWKNRSLLMNPASGNALLRLTYLSLVADPADAGAPVLTDNVLDALAYFTAAAAYAARGQIEQSKAMMGTGADPGPGTGALGFLDALLDLLVLNEQLIPRRSQEYSAGVPWGVGQAQIFPTT